MRAAQRCLSSRNRVLALVPFYAGLRIGETVALNNGDIRLSARKGLIIVRSGKAWCSGRCHQAYSVGARHRLGRRSGRGNPDRSACGDVIPGRADTDRETGERDRPRAEIRAGKGSRPCGCILEGVRVAEGTEIRRRGDRSKGEVGDCEVHGGRATAQRTTRMARDRSVIRLSRQIAAVQS